MFELARLCVGTVLYAAGLWGSVKILDRYNTRNSFYMALGIGLLFALIMPWLGLLFAVLPLMGLLFLLVFYYQLGYGHAFLVIVLQAVILYVAGELLREVVGDFSEETAVAWVLVVGFLLFMAFYVRRDLARRKSGVRDRRDAAPIPPARARRQRTPASASERTSPAEPKPVAAATPPNEAPRPPLPEAPPRPEPRPEPDAKPLPEPGDDPDEPRFLR